MINLRATRRFYGTASRRVPARRADRVSVATKAQGVAGEISADLRPGTVGDPITGDVVVLAVWYPAVADVLARYGDQLDGKVMADITNPIDVLV